VSNLLSALRPGPRQGVVLRLGSAQTLAWASSFYLPALLARPIGAELGLPTSALFAALSGALLISAAVSPLAGRWIDRHGGRTVLLCSSALLSAGLLTLAFCQGLVGLVMAWALLGLGMGLGLYDAAFATLVRLFDSQSRQLITGITLVGGFASTVGWPLTAWMESQWGWRGACMGWALLHVLLGAPLNASLPKVFKPASGPAGVGSGPLSAAAISPATDPDLAPQDAAAVAAAEPGPPAPIRAQAASLAPAQRRRLMGLLALIFTLMGFVSASVATHLPGILQAAGASLAVAVGLAALAGPSQVVARMLEWGALQRLNPLWTARAASMGHPLAAIVMLALGAPAALLFVVLHGLGNGLLTIVRGTLPLALFGAQGYGSRQGWIALPGRVVGALSPWLFGLALERWGVGALWLTGVSALLALALIWRLPAPESG